MQLEYICSDALYNVHCTYCWRLLRKGTTILILCNRESDLILIVIFEIGHIAADQFYSLSSILKKSVLNFKFSKNHKDLKDEYFLENLQFPSLYCKEHSPNRNFEMNNFCFKKWAKWTWTNEKTKHFDFVFTFKKKC